MLLRNLCCLLLFSALLSPATGQAQVSHELNPGSSARTPAEREDQARRARPMERLIPESPRGRRLPAVCNQAEAMRQWQDAIHTGVIDGARVQDGKLTMVVQAAKWQTYSNDDRNGLFELLNCMIAGPGQELTDIQVADQSGRIFQTWKKSR